MEEKEGTKIDIQEINKRFTIDCFGEIGLGTTIDSLNKEQTTFSHSFDEANSLIVKRFFNPFYKV